MRCGRSRIRPEFVLEVASVHTADRDDTEKRIGYANYGVSEYWRFDPTDGPGATSRGLRAIDLWMARMCRLSWSITARTTSAVTARR